MAIHGPAKQLGASVRAPTVPLKAVHLQTLYFSEVLQSQLSAGNAAEALPTALQHSIAAHKVATRTMDKDQLGISLNTLFPSSSSERKGTTDNSALNLFLSSAAATRERIALCVQVQFREVGDVHHALLGCIKASALYVKNCLVGSTLPAVTALLHRQRSV